MKNAAGMGIRTHDHLTWHLLALNISTILTIFHASLLDWSIFLKLNSLLIDLLTGIQSGHILLRVVVYLSRKDLTFNIRRLNFSLSLDIQWPSMIGIPWKTWDHGRLPVLPLRVFDLLPLWVCKFAVGLSQGYNRDWVISPSILLSHMDGCKKRQLSKRQYVDEEKLMSPFKAL